MTPSLPSSSYCTGGFWPVHGGNSGGVFVLGGRRVRCVAAGRISWLVKALDQGEPEVSRDGTGGDEATHVTIKSERAANSNFKGSRSPATARSRIILRSPLFWRVSAWTMAVTQSLGQKRSLEVTAPPDQTRRLGATTSTQLPLPCARVTLKNPTAVCSGPGRKRTPKRRAVLIKALGLGPAANSR